MTTTTSPIIISTTTVKPNPVINCKWSSWSYWSQCSVTCGNGNQERSRTKIQEASRNPPGLSCTGKDSERRPCSLQPCQKCRVQPNFCEFNFQDDSCPRKCVSRDDLTGCGKNRIRKRRQEQPEPEFVPQPSPQPFGCRADTQIMCPDKVTRFCETDRCNGIEDCPKESDEEKSFDELDCSNYSNITFTSTTTTQRPPYSPEPTSTTTTTTTTTMITTTTTTTTTTLRPDYTDGNYCEYHPDNSSNVKSYALCGAGCFDENGGMYKLFLE